MARLGVILAALAIGAACRAPPAAPAPPILGPPDEDTTAAAGDLDPAVAPTGYRLDLAIDPAADGYQGAVAIDVALSAPRRTLWLHAVGLTIERAAVTVGGATWPVVTTPGADGSGLVGFTSPRALPVGPARLAIEFRGRYRALDGVFVQEQRGRRYVFTDFEPVDARRAFPCFDAPRFKTPWTVSLTVPRGMVAAGNMPVAAHSELADGHQRLVLAPTRPLPSYLIAVAVGPFEVVETRGAPVPVRLLVPSGRADAARAAQALAPQMVAAAELFVGRPVPFPKIDIAVVPSFGGAMENPGLITIASDIALLPSGDVAAERLLALVLVHEAAHLWFGDLVTPRDWRELWLNEGFASWIADEVLAATRPAWETRLGELDDRAEAIAEDSVAGARAVRPAEVHAPRELFDVIGYKKGAAILHMIEDWLGAEAMRAGFDRYLGAHADAAVTTDDLVAALAPAPERRRELAAVLASFLDQPGVPRLDGELVCGPGGARAAVRLRRHAPGAPDRPARWTVPVCVRWHDGADVARRCQLVDGDAVIELGARCPRWLTLDGDADGYYQWSLPAADLARSATAVEASPRERVDAARQVVPALLAGALGAGDAVIVADVAIRHGDERVAAAGLEIARLLRDEVAPAAAQRLAPALAARLRDVGTRTGPADTASLVALRAPLIAAAGRAGDAPTVAWARRESQRWLERRSELPDDVLIAALTIAAAGADREQTIALVDTVIERLQREGRRAAFALAAVRPQLADEVLARARRGGLPLLRLVVAGMLQRTATADAAASVVEADPGLAPMMAAVPTCDAAIQARLTAAAGDAAKSAPLARLVERARARAAACQAARRRAP